MLRACEARVCASVGKKQVSGRISGDPGLIDEPSNTHVSDSNTQIFWGFMKLFIQGFKSIRDGQSISIGKKLTFLVGPNSAGKSIVHLALNKINGSDASFDFDFQTFYKNPNQSSQTVAFQTIGLSWREAGKNFSNYHTHYIESKNASDTQIQEFNYFAFGDNIKSKNRKNILFSITGDDNFDFYKINQYFEDEYTILLERFQDYENSIIPTQINVGGIASLDLMLEPDYFYNSHTKGFSKNAKKYRRLFELDKFIFIDFSKLRLKYKNSINQSLDILKERIEGFDVEKIGDFIYLNPCKLFNDLEKHIKTKCISGKDKQFLLNIFNKFSLALVWSLNNIKNNFQKNYPAKELKTFLVSGNRVPLKKEELINVLNFESTEDVNFSSLYLSGIDKIWGKYIKSNFINHKFGDDTLDKINNCLSEDLFLDNGYQIKIDSRLILGEEEFDTKEFSYIFEEEEKKIKCKFYCQLFLMDSHGRKLNFEDVGSGIGYVFPVLYHAFCPENKNKIVFMQQPELHLHPAMQANLTDVLIKGASDRRIIAETHSEHMILRALKRIRQTTARALIEENLKLTPEDVAINYFEPLGDGSTRVHTIRISEDGEFLDRWPQGFFAERDQELFDE